MISILTGTISNTNILVATTDDVDNDNSVATHSFTANLLARIPA